MSDKEDPPGPVESAIEAINAAVCAAFNAGANEGMLTTGVLLAVREAHDAARALGRAR